MRGTQQGGARGKGRGGLADFSEYYGNLISCTVEGV